jgi:hypothetical protein
MEPVTDRFNAYSVGEISIGGPGVAAGSATPGWMINPCRIGSNGGGAREFLRTVAHTKAARRFSPQSMTPRVLAARPERRNLLRAPGADFWFNLQL